MFNFEGKEMVSRLNDEINFTIWRIPVRAGDASWKGAGAFDDFHDDHVFKDMREV